MTKLTFLGAARTVTGSKYLLDIDGRKILIDCGLFQGLKEPAASKLGAAAARRRLTCRRSSSRMRISITQDICRAWLPMATTGA